VTGMFGDKKETSVKDIIASISELRDDTTVPKNVKEKVQAVIQTLNDEKEELSMRIDKVLQILDGVAEDSNLQSYSRTQVWNIVSMLEKVTEQKAA